VIADTECKILLDTLIAEPWSLYMNEEVWVKVIAVNVYGESEISDAGNDGLIKFPPEPPVNL